MKVTTLHLSSKNVLMNDHGCPHHLATVLYTVVTTKQSGLVLNSADSSDSGLQKRERRCSAPPAGVRGGLQHLVQTQEHSHVLCQAQQQSDCLRPHKGSRQHVSVSLTIQEAFQALGFALGMFWNQLGAPVLPQTVQRGRRHHPSLL